MTTGYMLDKNWVPVPKDIMRKSASMGFSKQEQKVFWFIIEKTLGIEDYKDVKTKKSIRLIKHILALTYFEKSIGVPTSTVKDALDSFKERNIVYLSKAPHIDNSGKMQMMITVELNLNTNQWKQKLKHRPNIGWNIKDILNPNLNKRELQKVEREFDSDKREYFGTKKYRLWLPDGTTEEIGEDIYHEIARLNPLHPKLGKFYRDTGFGVDNGEQQWTLGFQLYEKHNLVAEVCWKHKDKLIEIAKQGEIKDYGIIDMVLITKCQFCNQTQGG
jgi:hypothetical protein